MSWTWSWLAVPQLVGGGGLLVLAYVVYAARPYRPQNQRLALFLFLDGLTVGTGWGLRAFATCIADAYALSFIGSLGLWLVAPAYLWFLATLDTPLVSWLRTRIGKLVPPAMALGAVVLAFTWPDFYVAEMGRFPYVDAWRFSPRFGVLLAAPWVLGSLFGLVVALSAMGRATSETARRQAKAYAVAFGTHDALYVTLLGVAGVWPAWFDGTEAGNMVIFSFHGGAALVFGLLLARGILQTQLFDIELKVQRTLRQGTVVAILAAAYVGTNLGASSLMSPQAAQTTGVVLTGLLLFALVPLQRLGGRVADAAMPGVRDTPEYVEQRKLEVYGAALEDALDGGEEVVPHQATRLSHLRARLGLSDRDHAILLHAIQHRGTTTIVPRFEPGRTVLDRYRIEQILGQGGQGTTYKAMDTRLGREIVLKTVHGAGPRSTLKEARAMAAISHPNVVAIHDVERVGEHVYLVMEHVDGGSLKDGLGAGALGDAPFAHLAGDLLSGLKAVHDAGLIHRDVKPSNVLVTLDGTTKLADLGIATTADHGDQTTLGAGHTTARGTIAYMSPEQARGDKLTPASDLFSAAVTLFEAYTGRPLVEPFPGESAVELQARVARWSGLDEELDDADLTAWFAKALAPAPGDRFHEPAAMLATLGIEGRTDAASQAG